MSVLTPPAIPTPALRIIRIALAAGALLFGCLGLWLAGQRSEPPSDPANLAKIVYISYGFSALCAAGVFGVRTVRSRMAPAARPQISLIGWALAEASAMFGGVVQVLGGGILPWVAGMLVIAFSWMQIPADPEAE